MDAPIMPISRVVTLREVAEAAGVSTAAVSQAMNNTGSLSANTRERIKEFARQMGYVANQQAASLRRRSTRSIGFVMNADADPDSEQRWGAYYQRLLYALVTTAGKRGYSVTIIPDNQPELILSSRVDVLYYLDSQHDDVILAEAHRLGTPVITNDLLTDENSLLGIDSGYGDSTVAVLKLLEARGARRIGLLTEERGFPSDEIPEDLYVQWCAANSYDCIVAHGDWGRTNLFDKIDELLAENVDAIYSFYEEGPEILKYLEARGKRVPEDIQLVSACTGHCDPIEMERISAVIFHPEKGPELIFDDLIALAEGKIDKRIHVKLPWELVEHGSTRS